MCILYIKGFCQPMHRYVSKSDKLVYNFQKHDWKTSYLNLGWCCRVTYTLGTESSGFKPNLANNSSPPRCFLVVVRIILYREVNCNIWYNGNKALYNNNNVFSFKKLRLQYMSLKWYFLLCCSCTFEEDKIIIVPMAYW